METSTISSTLNSTLLDLEEIINEKKFDWPEYLVFSIILFISGCIGIYFGCFGSKQSSQKEFLTGNRQCKPFEIALSLLCSSISAISMLGIPLETYKYGLQFSFSLLVLIPLTLVLYYVYIPVFFSLELTSGYEYFQMRYNSQVRISVSAVSIIYMIPYLSAVVYGPAISLSLVTGLNHNIFVVAIFLVCTFYSSLGGLKAVLATDVLQGLVMISSLIVVVVKGLVNCGGFKVLWSKVKQGERDEFFNFSLDTNVRYTVFSTLLGSFFMWLTVYGSSQSNIQRYVSLPNFKSVKKALLINLISLTLTLGLCYFCGLLVYAKYFDCDPISSKQIKNHDQMIPLYTMDTLSDIPGLSGLLVSGIVSASLSTVSSVLNSLPALITEDFIKKWKPNLSDTQLSTLSKIITVLTGLISFSMVFLIELLDANILPTVTSLIAVVCCPVLGLFSLGMFCPWTNSKSALIGFFGSIFLMFFLVISGMIYKARFEDTSLKPLSTSGCLFNSSTIGISSLEVSSSHYQSDDDKSNLIHFLLMSHMWYPPISVFLVLAIGNMYMLITETSNPSPKKDKEKLSSQPVNSKLISPPFLKLYKIILQKKTFKKLITIDGDTEIFNCDSNSNSVPSDLNLFDLRATAEAQSKDIMPVYYLSVKDQSTQVISKNIEDPVNVVST